uniref:Caspase-8 n=1 Tax=Xiphophorus maculatus TaxID=8083 RepID=A0A3B5R5M5_XIPMA
MDFQKALLEVGKSLSTDEVEALSFLCTDILSRKPVTLDGASNLFSLLMKEDRLSAGNPQLLVELLLTIQRPVILQNIKLSLPSPSTLISPYRKLLYRLSEQITEEELGDMKFLLKDIPRRRLEQKTTLGVFLEMEHMDLINESSLEYLETIFKSVCPVLNEEIRLFRKGNPFIIIDIHQMRNMTFYFKPHVLCDYPMTGKRGICLIVDNFDFSESYKNLTNTLRNREGTKFDRGKFMYALKEVFGWLGYEVDIHVDYNADQIKSLFTRIGQQDHSQYDSLVCCILSHGMEGKVYGVDGKLVEIKLLIECIDGENCPSLIEKPKMLFIQACQGCKEQYPVQPDGIEDETTRIFADAKIADLRSPVIADLLVGMSTVPDHASFRDKFCGTWYIQSLCKNLIKCVPRRVDLVSILTKVNFDVSGMTDFSRRRKQMPQPAFSLRKRVVFPVPEKRPPEIGALTKDNS